MFVVSKIRKLQDGQQPMPIGSMVSRDRVNILKLIVYPVNLMKGGEGGDGEAWEGEGFILNQIFILFFIFAAIHISQKFENARKIDIVIGKICW